MSSEVYAVKISVDSASSTATTSGEHFGAVVCVFADNNIDGNRTLSSITDSNGMDILGNATLAAISASSGTAQYEQTELGGTAVAGAITVTTTDSAGSSGNLDVYVYIAP
tara:strand:- start:399 stop:728 length:330 start_codon:yes stop_codon:yes gene_type:complete